MLKMHLVHLFQCLLKSWVGNYFNNCYSLILSPQYIPPIFRSFRLALILCKVKNIQHIFNVSIPKVHQMSFLTTVICRRKLSLNFIYIVCFMAQVENLNFLIKLFYTQECNMNLQFLYLNGCIGKTLKWILINY